MKIERGEKSEWLDLGFKLLILLVSLPIIWLICYFLPEKLAQLFV